MTEPAATPVPNKADAAWEHLEKLRDELRALGVEVDARSSIVELEQAIARLRRS